MFDTSVILNNDNIQKIRLSKFSWNDLFKDKTILYEAISNLLLDSENLIYYATQKESSKTLDETKKYIKLLIKNGSINSNLNDILNCIGWNSDIDISNTRFQGDLAEYLMNILLDKFSNTETIISKISLKTSSKMPVFGNDNVYYDFDNEILYFGESKFYSNFLQALDSSLESISKHQLIEEVSYVRNHTGCFIASNGEKRMQLVERFEQQYSDDLTIKNIIFIINDDIFNKLDYEEKLISYFGDEETIRFKCEEIIFVFLPILSKREFLNYFKGRLNNE